MKRSIPFAIAAAVGFVLIASYFVPYTQSWGEDSMVWFDILASIAFILGAANLLKMNLEKISNQRAGWGYAVVTLIAFLITLVVGLGKIGVLPSESFPSYTWSGNHVSEGSALWWIYQYVIFPLSSTMFALLAFFIASAAFRAFRAKNSQAIILLTTAFIVLLGRTYAGIVLTSWMPEELSALRLENVTDTIMQVFNLAGNRAITIGIALGVVSTSLKVLLGVDRSYLGSERE